MDRFYDDLHPRSASMPSPGTNIPPIGFQPMDALMYRKLSRRDSEMILSEGSITPPESPGPESKTAGLAEKQQQQSLQQRLPHQSQTQINKNVVNTNHSKESPPHIDYPATPVSQVPETPDGRDEDMDMEVEVDSRYLAISKQPVRMLSSENLQSSSSDSLKLTDFEVRGTLGMSFFPFFLLGLTGGPDHVSGTGTFGKVLLVCLRSNTVGENEPSRYFPLKILRKNEIVRLRQVEHVAAERYILCDAVLIRVHVLS